MCVTAPCLVLPNEHEVDDPDDSFSLQALQLGPDLAAEAVAVETDDEHLDRSIAHGEIVSAFEHGRVVIQLG